MSNMNALYADLEWLPRAPPDFAKRLSRVDRTDVNVGSEIRSLAMHALDLNQLTKLAKIIGSLRSEAKSLAPLVPFRLAVLSNSTIDFIVPALVASAARHGVELEVIQPSYNQVAPEALTPDSAVNSSKPDAVLFALDYRAVPLRQSPGDPEAALAMVEGAIGYFQMLHDGIKRNSKAVCIFQSIAPPAETLFGSLDGAMLGTLRGLVNGINWKLAEFVSSTGSVLFDVAALAQTVGLADWHDTQLWQLGKFSFSDHFIPLYADHVARLIAALRGKSRKALILDLDNTIWGGVIGDDGLEGIKIAQGDATGEAHLAVQQLALDLRQRGIVLAVSSKNTDAVAREPFLKHPEMLLRLEHIAVFQANWNDKATNIRAIAEELSLGLDAMVFLDDNPMERGLVRSLIPEVAVPELPQDPAYYARTLAAAGYFEAVTFAAEDLKRAGFYQENAKRAELKKQLGGVDAYLATLNMTITFQPFDATGRARIVQLINKSNQYNLTTRRYTDPEVRELEGNPDVFTLQVRLSDSFGDNGMISVVICRRTCHAVWELDTWLMSCRVLGRKVENMVLRELISQARATGVIKLVGTYRPSGRNGLVIDHYSKLGFARIGGDDTGLTQWELLVDGAVPDGAPMKVVSIGFGTSLASSLA